MHITFPPTPSADALPPLQQWDHRMYQLSHEGEAEGGAEGFRGRRQAEYEAAFVTAMTGRGDFWAVDDEQRYVSQLKALQDACALVGVTAAERWAYLEGALSALAHEWAFARAEEQ